MSNNSELVYNNPDLIETDEKVILSKERMRLALEAAWEIDALSITLHSSITEDYKGLAAKRVVQRINFLGGIITTAITDPIVTTEGLKLRSGFSSKVMGL
jgi:hypothetical protein